MEAQEQTGRRVPTVVIVVLTVGFLVVAYVDEWFEAGRREALAPGDRLGSSEEPMLVIMVANDTNSPIGPVVVSWMEDQTAAGEDRAQLIEPDGFRIFANIQATAARVGYLQGGKRVEVPLLSDVTLDFNVVIKDAGTFEVDQR